MKFFLRKFHLRKPIKIILAMVIILIVLPAALIWALSLFSPTAQPPYTYGATFRYPYSELLGQDWRDIYLQLLTELNVKHVRLPVYWDRIEKTPGKFDFSDLDYQMTAAQEHGVKVILVVGRRVPGWPECFIPDWASDLTFEDQQKHLLTEILAVVQRYKNHPALEFWQVENEPYLTTFGACPRFDVSAALDQEIVMVRLFDSTHKIIVTDSGELSIWIRAAKRADIFGSTLYRRVYFDRLRSYVNYHLPPRFFRAKMTLVHWFKPGQPIINIELQAEPWTPGLKDATFMSQAITFPPGALTDNVTFAHSAGFSTTYLWGVEYWYWAANQGHPEFLQEAKKILLHQ